MIGRYYEETGGLGGEGAAETRAVLDLGTMVFTPGPAMANQRFGCAAVVLPGSSHVLVVGGTNDDDESLSSTELLSLGTMAFEPGPQMLSPRQGCTAVVLDARRVLVIGGKSDDAPSNFATTEMLDTGTMTFAPGPTMQSRRCGCAAVLLPGKRRVLVRDRWLERQSRRDEHDGSSLPRDDDFRGGADDAHGTLRMRRVSAAARPIASLRPCHGRTRRRLQPVRDGGARCRRLIMREEGHRPRTADRTAGRALWLRARVRRMLPPPRILRIVT